MPTEGKSQLRLFPTDPFDGFGPTHFRPPEETVIGRAIAGKRASRLKRGVRESAPRMPGVYGMLDPRGRVIYIGKAKNLRARLLCYFRENSRDPKAGKIIRHTHTLVWEQCGDEFAALLRELELIQHFRPRFNVLGQPGMSRYQYICVGRPPAAYVYVARRPTGKELAAFGPLFAKGKAHAAVRRLNHWFGLRDCPQTVPMMFAEQPELFPHDRSAGCLRYDLGTCLAPCAGYCTQADYSAALRSARAFLDGRERGVLATLKAKMTEAAERFEFEQATAHRDRLLDLEWLDARLTMIRQARNRNSFVYPLMGPDGTERWYLIHRGQVRGVVFAPNDAPERRTTVAAALTEAFRPHPPSHGAMSGGAIDSVLLVAAWFRKYEPEKERLLTKAIALGQCRPAE